MAKVLESQLHASKVMLKNLQARLQPYVNRELSDVQALFRKDRGMRGQIGNICWIIGKAVDFQKNIYLCFIDYAKSFDYVNHKKMVETSSRDRNTRASYLPPQKSVCKSRRNSSNHTRKNGVVQNWERSMSMMHILSLLI